MTLQKALPHSLFAFCLADKAWILSLDNIQRNLDSTGASEFFRIRELAFNSNTLDNSIYQLSLGDQDRRAEVTTGVGLFALKEKWLINYDYN